MDWLKSALDDDSSNSDDESSHIEAVSPPKIADAARRRPPESAGKGKRGSDPDEPDYAKDEDPSVSIEAGKTDGPTGETDTSPAVPLFSVVTKARTVESYKAAEHVPLNLPQGYHDHEEDVATYLEAAPAWKPEESTTMMEPVPVPTAIRNQGKMDTMEIMQCFNMIHTGGTIKAPKQRDWFGSDIKVTEICADDLRMSKIEKDKRYSTSKAALVDGKSAYKAPTRMLETDDGQLLTTNVMRKTSKRKHQISWLASEAQERELELLERTAQARKTKHETQMKYGW